MGERVDKDEEEQVGIGLRSGSRLFQSLGAAMRKERLVIFREDLHDSRRRVRQPEERVEPGGWTVRRLRR